MLLARARCCCCQLCVVGVAARGVTGLVLLAVLLPAATRRRRSCAGSAAAAMWAPHPAWPQPSGAAAVAPGAGVLGPQQAALCAGLAALCHSADPASARVAYRAPPLRARCGACSYAATCASMQTYQNGVAHCSPRPCQMDSSNVFYPSKPQLPILEACKCICRTRLSHTSHSVVTPARVPW